MNSWFKILIAVALIVHQVGSHERHQRHERRHRLFKRTLYDVRKKNEMFEYDDVECDGAVCVGRSFQAFGKSCTSDDNCTEPYMVCVNEKCSCNSYTRRVEDFCDPVDWRCPLGEIYKDADGSSELCRSNLQSYNDICDSGYYCNPVDDVSGQTGNITVNGICCPKHRKGVIKVRAVCPVGKPQDVYGDCKRNCPTKTHFCHKDPYVTHVKELCCPRACQKGFYFNGFVCAVRL